MLVPLLSMREVSKFLLLVLTASCFALDDGLAHTQPRGWRSWNTFKDEITQDVMDAQVDALVTRRHGKPSLLEVGYDDIGLDDGWQACGMGVNHSFHDHVGFPNINTSSFANMSQMVSRAHEKGVKMGFYLNNCLCSEAKTAPGGHAM